MRGWTSCAACCWRRERILAPRAVQKAPLFRAGLRLVCCLARTPAGHRLSLTMRLKGTVLHPVRGLGAGFQIAVRRVPVRALELGMPRRGRRGRRGQMPAPRWCRPAHGYVRAGVHHIAVAGIGGASHHHPACGLRGRQGYGSRGCQQDMKRFQVHV